MERKRIVVKIGSSSLAHREGGIAISHLTQYSKAIAHLHRQGHDLIFITSGAVAAGFQRIGYATKPVTTEKKQAAAALGQGLLMEAYQHAFMQEGIGVAQLLLTRESFQQEHQYTNAYDTLQELLKRRIIPIINENDSIAVEELTFGDNDWLASLVAGLTRADTLILLTDVNGVYDRHPHHPDTRKINRIETVTPEMLTEADQHRSTLGSGGMRSKLEAARNAQSFGIETFIGKGNDAHALQAIIQGEGDGTYVSAISEHAWPKEKQWVGIYSPVEGEIVIDDGAKDALLYGGKSLLSVGVRHIHGSFTKGSVIAVFDEVHEPVGKGRAALSATDMRSVLNRQPATIFIHRNHWVSTSKGSVFSD
ncbi:glutamate 5-kinase [Natribacillus halophilus]|uniref:Glutamate 5-kinase n=1 Tax=Natribacillus halophilus TaxID=549003 RepID=A0A1G8MDF9_9BACI|nr:glutamate 5-kinase [Natribacillus halophilus]SDI65999.1 glutamate 5-kinase [Natribacillus halophilus]